MVVIASYFFVENSYYEIFPYPHKITFNPSQCYECIYCDCQYTVDDEDVYTLDKVDKLTCSVNPYGANSIAIKQAIRKADDEMHVFLKGRFYAEFQECALEKAKTLAEN